MPYFLVEGIRQDVTWTPADVSPAFWYDATFGTIVDGSNNVTIWADLSGQSNDINLIPAGGTTLNAVLVPNVKNGLPGVRFDTSGSHNSVLVTPDPVSLTQAFTIVMAIVTINTPEDFATVLMDATPNVAMLTRDAAHSNQPAMYATTLVPIRTSVLLTGTAYTLYGQFAGASSIGGVNGVPGSTGDAGSSNLSGSLQLGREGAGLQFSGYMLETFGFPGVDPTNLSNALSYLTTKWGPF